MATQKAEFDGSVWFFTRADDPKVDEVRRDDSAPIADWLRGPEGAHLPKGRRDGAEGPATDRARSAERTERH